MEGTEVGKEGSRRRREIRLTIQTHHPNFHLLATKMPDPLHDAIHMQQDGPPGHSLVHATSSSSAVTRSRPGDSFAYPSKPLLSPSITPAGTPRTSNAGEYPPLQHTSTKTGPGEKNKPALHHVNPLPSRSLLLSAPGGVCVVVHLVIRPLPPSTDRPLASSPLTSGMVCLRSRTTSCRTSRGNDCPSFTGSRCRPTTSRTPDSRSRACPRASSRSYATR